MNYGKDENSTFHTFILLDANVLFLTLRTIWESLILSVIMECYLGTLKHPRHTKFTTLEPQFWKKLSMQDLMTQSLIQKCQSLMNLLQI